MVHFISYDLNGKDPSSSYKAVAHVITTNTGEYRHGLESGWWARAG
jgi:hypothetical protein